jgi:EF hand
MALTNIMSKVAMQQSQYQAAFTQQHSNPHASGAPRVQQGPIIPDGLLQGLPDSKLGSSGSLTQPSGNRGYGLDLNGNGRYDKGQDGVLAFDLNHDGKISASEIRESNERLKAFGGNYDLNGDGKVTPCERLKAEGYKKEMQKLDTDGDGKLSASEIERGGGRICVDRNGDGKISPAESFSAYSFPMPGFGDCTLGYVDPRNNQASVIEFG